MDLAAAVIEMGKTKRKNPVYATDDDRWIKKGAKHLGPSRKSQKQDFEQEIEEVLRNGY
jgi:hypothetical protein